MRERGWVSHLVVVPVYLPKERPRSPKLGYTGNTGVRNSRPSLYTKRLGALRAALSRGLKSRFPRDKNS